MGYEALERLARLRQNGALTEDEFSAAKAKVLAGDIVTPHENRSFSREAVLALIGVAVLIGIVVVLWLSSPGKSVPPLDSVEQNLIGSDGKAYSDQDYLDRSPQPNLDVGSGTESADSLGSGGFCDDRYEDVDGYYRPPNDAVYFKNPSGSCLPAPTAEDLSRDAEKARQDGFEVIEH